MQGAVTYRSDLETRLALAAQAWFEGQSAQKQAETGIIALAGTPQHPIGRWGWVGKCDNPQQINICDQNDLQNLIRPQPGRWVVALLPYEAGHACLHLPVTPSLGWRCTLSDVFQIDHHAQTLQMLCSNPNAPDDNWHQEILALLEAEHTPSHHRVREHSDASGRPLTWSYPDRADYEYKIQSVQQWLKDGEVYQANYSHVFALHGPQTEHPCFGAQLFHTLHTLNPVPHGAWLQLPGFQMVSNSMETLMTYTPQNRRLASYPIKGTQAAGRSDESQRLNQIAKERAEHMMIVDLIRNDLGKVCTPGTISVPNLMKTYRFHGVEHGISHIQGTLDASCSPQDAILALFPGGSITGCPKRRAVRHLASIEQQPRGAYTGTLMMIAPDGAISASILIRTMLQERRNPWQLQVGGGIVIDSEPRSEYDETLHKSAIFRAATHAMQSMRHPASTIAEVQELHPSICETPRASQQHA